MIFYRRKVECYSRSLTSDWELALFKPGFTPAWGGPPSFNKGWANVGRRRWHKDNGSLCRFLRKISWRLDPAPVRLLNQQFHSSSSDHCTALQIPMADRIFSDGSNNIFESKHSMELLAARSRLKSGSPFRFTYLQLSRKSSPSTAHSAKSCKFAITKRNEALF